MKLAATDKRPVGSKAEALYKTFYAQLTALFGWEHAWVLPIKLNISRLEAIDDAVRADGLPLVANVS